MKKLSTLFGWLLLAGVASAAPYIVYSGSITGSNYSANGAANASVLLYLVTDVADTSNFAVLIVDPVHKTYSVIGRPSDSPASDEGLNNFLGSVGTRAVLSYSIQTTDSSNNTYISRAYATGPLSTRSAVLAAARKSLLVHIKTNRVANGTYTFGTPTAAVTTGDLPYATTLAGSASGYVIDSGGSLVHATTSGNLSLRLNPVITGLANVGGGFAVSLATEIAVMPVSVADGQSESDAFVAWFSAFAQALGYSSSSANSSNSSAGGSLSSSFSVSVGSGGTLALGGTITGANSFSGGTSILVGNGGTLQLNTGGTVATTVNPGQLTGISMSTGAGLLTIGGASPNTSGSVVNSNLTFNLNSTSTLTLIDTGSLTFNNAGGGGLILNGGVSVTGTYTLIGGSSGTLTGTDGTISVTSPSSTLSLTNATLTLTALNGGNADGTVVIVTPAGNGATLTFAGSALTVNGSTDLSTLNVGESLTGTVTVTGGTSVSGTYTGGSVTVTTP